MIYRVRVRRGGRKRTISKGIVFGKPATQGVNQLKWYVRTHRCLTALVQDDRSSLSRAVSAMGIACTRMSGLTVLSFCSLCDVSAVV